MWHKTLIFSSKSNLLNFVSTTLSSKIYSHTVQKPVYNESNPHESLTIKFSTCNFELQKLVSIKITNKLTKFPRQDICTRHVVYLPKYFPYSRKLLALDFPWRCIWESRSVLRLQIRPVRIFLRLVQVGSLQMGKCFEMQCTFIHFSAKNNCGEQFSSPFSVGTICEVKMLE